MQQGPASPPLNTRRPPPHFPLGLRHETASPASSTCSLKAQAARDEETRQSHVAWRLSPFPRSSEESNESAESLAAPVERWFNRSNNNVGGRLAPRFIDDDPPFFLQTQNCSDPNLVPDMDGLYPPPRASNPNASQFTADAVRAGTNESSMDDFRSVIDDLTIENKRLKEKLRKYKTSYSSHLEKDKLFEVKVHGLSPRKKRELEETLHAFASSISKGGSTESSKFPSALKTGLQPVSLRYGSKKSSSPSTSNSRLVDSAYASLSTSGPMSLSASNQNGGGKNGCALPAETKIGKVQSFLDDIPKGLFPKHSTVMTERGKRKLVVRRLEQLFTGRTRVPGGLHSQPQQQQEVSNSAARDDRQAIESRGQQVTAEGVREAHILDTEIEQERVKISNLPAEASTGSSTASQAETVDRGCGSLTSPDQRPTRPLDLDPDRQQVPAENIEYIRHLGISTPVMAVEDATDMPPDVDGHGWVYLNLLINMAQLHIINVTTDFVRTAVTELSTKFQLSPDGRKIRWRGGTEGTELSSDSGGDSAQRQSPNDSDSLDEGSRKRRKVDANKYQISAVEPNPNQARPTAIPEPKVGNAQSQYLTRPRYDLSYRPLFVHRSSSQDDSMSIDDNTSPISYAAADEGDTGLVSSGLGAKGNRSQSRVSSKRVRSGGAIVFYNGGEFCIDLSGDRDHISTPLHVAAVDVDGFSHHSYDALGCKIKRFSRPLPTRTPSGSVLGFRPFKDYSVCASTRSRTPDLTEFENSDYFNFSPSWTSAVDQEPDYLKLDACGLGGTRPADHFTVTVETRRTKLDSRTRAKMSRFSAPSRRCQRFLHKISKSSLDTFTSSEEDESVTSKFDSMSLPPESYLRSEILSSRIRHLKPSDLPPPATYHGACPSSMDWSDDTSSDSEREVVTRLQRPPSSFYRPISHHSVDNLMNTEQEDMYRNGDISSIDDSETSSIDMLAHARRIHPKTIAAKEAEFDGNLVRAPMER